MSVELECIDPALGGMLTDYTEERLPRGEGRLFAAHLAACARCEDDHRTLGALRSAIAGLPPGKGTLLGCGHGEGDGTAADRAGGMNLARVRDVASRLAIALGIALASFAVGSWWQGWRAADVALRVHEIESRLARIEARSSDEATSGRGRAASAALRPAGEPQTPVGVPAVGVDFAVPLSF